jgi:two-component system LytT family response regulator
MLRTVIIDDEPIAVAVLKKILSVQPDVEICATFTDALKALPKLAELNPDVIFLDIDMPGIDGLSLARHINEKPDAPSIVFTTAHEGYMLDALRNQAFDFLTKPIDSSQLASCLARIEKKQIEEIKRHQRENLTRIEQPVKFNNRTGFVVFKPAEILCCLAEGSYSVIHLISGPITLPYNIGKIEATLPKGYFLRVNRSAFVNPNYVRIVDKKNHCVTVGYGEKIMDVPMSAPFYPLIEELFEP